MYTSMSQGVLLNKFGTSNNHDIIMLDSPTRRRQHDSDNRYLANRALLSRDNAEWICTDIFGMLLMTGSLSMRRCLIPFLPQSAQAISVPPIPSFEFTITPALTRGRRLFCDHSKRLKVMAFNHILSGIDLHNCWERPPYAAQHER